MNLLSHLVCAWSMHASAQKKPILLRNSPWDGPPVFLPPFFCQGWTEH
jgi:hypothetical protein